MDRLASRLLPPLSDNPALKAVLRKVDEAGRFESQDLTEALVAAGNISAEEDEALRAIFVDAPDIVRGADDLAWKRFVNHLSLEKGCRETARVTQIRSGVARAFSGGAMGIATGASLAPMIGTTVEQWAFATVASLLGMCVGFRLGAHSDYGVKN